MHFKKYFLFYTLLPLFVLCVSSAFFRFVVLDDYIVKYEVECDPAMYNCYIGCTDEQCSEEYYYLFIQRRLSDLQHECGDSIIDCQFAQRCAEGEVNCTLTSCSKDSNEQVCKTEIPL